MVWSSFCYSILLFSWGNRGKPIGKTIFTICACALPVWLTCACALATKTMAVRIFRSGKITNFGGLFFQIVHLFRSGNNGFLWSKFLSIDSCKNYVVPREVQRNCIFWMLIPRSKTGFSPISPWKQQNRITEWRSNHVSLTNEYTHIKYCLNCTLHVVHFAFSYAKLFQSIGYCFKVSF